MSGYIGKVAEVRLNPKRQMEMTLRQRRDVETFLDAFNKRGGGSFKMCIGETREIVEAKLQVYLAHHVRTGWAQDLAPFLDFRVNYNSVDDHGMTWEGFGIASFDWKEL